MPYQTSSQTWTWTLWEQNEQKILQLNTIHTCSTKVKASLLQWFSKGNTLNKDELERLSLEWTTSETNNMTQPSMSFYHSSAMSLGMEKDPYLKTLLTMMKPVSVTPNLAMYSPTRNKESEMPWFSREEEKEAGHTGKKDHKESRKTLSFFAQDYKAIKQQIKTSRTAPLSFPSSEWDNIIENKLSTLMLYSPHCTTFQFPKRTLDM